MVASCPIIVINKIENCPEDAYTKEVSSFRVCFQKNFLARGN